MLGWSFWGLLATGAAGAFALFKVATAIKDTWLKQAKPKLLDPQECLIYEGGRKVGFDLLVDNSAGSKDCSVISVELVLVKGYPAELWIAESTPLPKTIPAGRSERIVMNGYCTKLFKVENKIETKLDLQPEQNSFEGEVAVKFNTGKTIKKKITFIIKRP